MAKKQKRKKKNKKKLVTTITHDDAKRTNIPTAEFQSVMAKDDARPVRVAYERRPGGAVSDENPDPLAEEKAARNRDLDPQLVWRGKDEQDWSDLVVAAPPLFIQEKIHPKVLVDDLLRRTQEERRQEEEAAEPTLFPDLYADFNGLPDTDAKTEFYQHEANWTNRMILGDSLQVMASLAEREGLRGRVQCIYLDPPYGIKFNSNFQWSTTSRQTREGSIEHITREPEQVKAFRDTWRDGVHSYLSYLRDRLTVCRDLLGDSGSIFVQIGDENVHRVRGLLDNVFGETHFLALITVEKTSAQPSETLSQSTDYVLHYAKDPEHMKVRKPLAAKTPTPSMIQEYSHYEDEYTKRFSMRGVRTTEEWDKYATEFRVFSKDNTTSNRPPGSFPVEFRGVTYVPSSGFWKTGEIGFKRLRWANRLEPRGRALRYVRYFDDYAAMPIHNIWTDVKFSSRRETKAYVVQTSELLVQRCILMATDPGDLVLDPTCGSGTTAYVAEQWGRRWITMDTSRVSLALARARIMGARYPFYLLADSKEGVEKEAEVTRTELPDDYKHRHYAGNVRQGFVYERVPHITLKSIANNAEIDVIWERFQKKLEPVRERLNEALGKKWEEWQIPRELDEKSRANAEAVKLHADWWALRIARQKEIDASIAAKAESEYLYDKPYRDKSKIRVAGPFTVESLSPHRVLTVGADDELIDPLEAPARTGDEADFARMILENLSTAGVQQAQKEDRITFSSIAPWPGHYISAEGRYVEGDSGKSDSGGPSPRSSPDKGEGAKERRAGILIGPEFGTVARQDLVAAAREAGDAEFDVLIACAFNYEARASEFSKLGRIPVLKARMNADLHMADDLKNTGKGNLFVIFGEPDIGVYEGGSAALDEELRRRADRLGEMEKKIAALKDEVDELSKQKRAGGGDVAEKVHKAKAKIAGLTRETDRIRSFMEYAETVPDGRVFVQIFGVDVFKPQTGEVESAESDDIACWFIDTDYNEESFFVRHAYFLGQSDPYKSLKTTLKAEINEDAWATLHSDTSRPFEKPKTGRIAVKVINHLGDEVMKVFWVE